MLSHSFLKFRNRFAQVFLCLIAVVSITNSCKKNNNQKWIDVDPAFAKYVEAYTTGVVSKTSSVRVQLAADAATDRKSTRLNSSHRNTSRMPSSA